MGAYIEEAYILTLDYFRNVLPRYAIANGFTFKEMSCSKFAISDLLDQFDLPEDDSPLVIANTLYQHYEIWGRRAVEREEYDVANLFLVSAEVLRDLIDYLAEHGVC